MKKLFLLSILLVSTSFLMGQDSIKPTWTTKWNHGAEIKRSDGEFKFKVGGRIQFDVMNIYQDEALSNEFEAENGAEFRRLRLFASGTLYKIVKFKLQFDFAKGDAGVKDAYLEVTKIPAIGNFRVGHFKQPFGLEMQTSSNHVLFMERGLTNAFTPERDLGFMIHNRHFNGRFAWFAGFFYPSGSVGKYLGYQRRLTGRVAGLPLYKTDGRYTVLHVGFAYAYQYHNNEELQITQRPEAHLAPKYINLKVDEVNKVDAVGGELTFVSGSFALQGELMYSRIKPSDSAAAEYDLYGYYAYYGSFSWFITGEHRNFSPSKTSYDRVDPKKNLGRGGVGAFEIVARYSHIDMNDKDLSGGSLTDYTFGLNWYLNPATKLRFNYVYSNVFNSGYANIVMLRFQVTF